MVSTKSSKLRTKSSEFALERLLYLKSEFLCNLIGRIFGKFNPIKPTPPPLLKGGGRLLSRSGEVKGESENSLTNGG